MEGGAAKCPAVVAILMSLTSARGRDNILNNFKEVSMKKAAAFSVMLLLTSLASAQVFFNGTWDQAMAAAKAENKKVLLDFTSYT